MPAQSALFRACARAAVSCISGMAIISDSLIAVSNDDDFGIMPDGKGSITEKRLPGEGNRVDLNHVYFIRLDKPLR